MKLEQFQSMVRIEYTAGEEATAVVRLPVLAASDVLLTGGLNVYWASPVLALSEPFVHTNQPIQVIEVDLIKLLKSLKMPSGTYCLRRATPMDKLLVQPAPNRVLKQEHLNLLYHQLLYIQQELCEVKFIRAEVIRDGTYNGGVLQDPKVTPDPDPEKPNPVKPTPDMDTPKPVPKPSVDDDTKPIPSSAELVAQGYEIAYVQDGVPLIFGLQPFRMNKKQQQIDKNGYRTVNNIVSDLLVSDPRKAFTTYADAVGIKPTAAMLEAKNYRKNSYGEYIGEKPRYQTTVLPSNSPFGSYAEVSKDANGYAINLRKDRDTGTYQWFVNLAPSSTESNGSTETQPTTPSSGTGSAVTPAEPAPEHREEHREEPAPANEDRGATIKEVHSFSDLPRYERRNNGDNMQAYGYTEDSHYNYPAIPPITKYVAADDASEDVQGVLPLVLDKNGSVLQWAIETNRELSDQPTVAYWAVEYDGDRFS